MAPTSRPRRRPRKGLRRVDAALDAMRRYGFEDRLIVSTVNGLLKVYGEEGWLFIEEYSYKVLLEAMLEKVEENENQGRRNEIQDTERHENNAEISAAGTSSRAPVSTCHDTEAIPATSRTIEALHADPQAGIITDTASSNGNASFPLSEREGSKWKDIEQDQHFVKKQINNETVVPVKIEGIGELGNTSILPPLPLNDLPCRKRRPCYGWLSSDDDEEGDDLVQLKLGPLPTDRSENHKRSWDVKPEDV